VKTGDDSAHEEAELFDLFTHLTRDRIAQVKKKSEVFNSFCAEILEMASKNSYCILAVLLNYDFRAVYFGKNL
jgi:hypothetical protein